VHAIDPPRRAPACCLLARRPDGIILSDFEQSEIGLICFAPACQMGFEGLVSTRRDSPYQAGRAIAYYTKSVLLAAICYAAVLGGLINMVEQPAQQLSLSAQRSSA
jgi:hypothetical protein